MGDGPEIVTGAESTTAVVRDVVRMDRLPALFDRAFSAVAATLGSQGIAPNGPAFALYHGITDGEADLEVGFPTASPIEPAGGVEVGSVPAGRAARLVHHGSYDELGSSWEQLRTWMAEQGYEAGPDFVEVYVTEPTPDMDPADLRTELLWPLA